MVNYYVETLDSTISPLKQKNIKKWRIIMDYSGFPTPKNVFARVGMSHVTKHLGDPYAQMMSGLKGIRINTSSQPNANPHFGTLVTLMCVAAIAQELSSYFGKPAYITFDMLENAPDRKKQGIRRRNVDGKEIDFQISLADSIMDDGKSLAEHNMITFLQLFDFLEKRTGIVFEVRSYRKCQSDKFFRESLLKIFNHLDVFEPIIAPSGESIRLRFPCPECKLVDKGSVNTRIIFQNESEIIFEAFCPDHGHHQATLTVDSGDYFDTNTPLRDVAKVPGLIECGRQDMMMPLMIDGRDWSGRWDRCIHLPGVAHLGYHAWDLPARIYTPVVTDLLGAKLSKSLYVGNLYEHMPRGFADLSDFMLVYGKDGLERLWNHVRQWASDPAYMDRDSYTILYFALLLADKLERANIMG